ncbi:hypothetical protein [Microbacterium sp. 1S1]|nr:hypothetical protein [Microbacterium sp. 1S1]
MPYRKSSPEGLQLDIGFAGTMTSLAPNTPGLRVPGVGGEAAKTTTLRLPLPAGAVGTTVTLGSLTSNRAGGVLLTGVELSS